MHRIICTQLIHRPHRYCATSPEIVYHLNKRTVDRFYDDAVPVDDGDHALMQMALPMMTMMQSTRSMALSLNLA